MGKVGKGLEVTFKAIRTGHFQIVRGKQPEVVFRGQQSNSVHRELHHSTSQPSAKKHKTKATRTIQGSSSMTHGLPKGVPALLGGLLH